MALNQLFRRQSRKSVLRSLLGHGEATIDQGRQRLFVRARLSAPRTGGLSWPRWVRWSVAYAVVLAVLMFGEFNLVPFYYFQF